MVEVAAKIFEGQTIQVDGNTYRECRFEGCVIDYGGGSLPSFIGCTFIDGCQLSLSGNAGNTIAYLQSIYAGFGDWGSTNIEIMFDAIRGAASESGHRPVQ